MFSGFDGNDLVWPDGPPGPADTVIFATGYRPSLGYVEGLGASRNGQPLHVGGLSTTHPGLAQASEQPRSNSGEGSAGEGPRWQLPSRRVG